MELPHVDLASDIEEWAMTLIRWQANYTAFLHKRQKTVWDGDKKNYEGVSSAMAPSQRAAHSQGGLNKDRRPSSQRPLRRYKTSSTGSARGGGRMKKSPYTQKKKGGVGGRQGTRAIFFGFWF